MKQIDKKFHVSGVNAAVVRIDPDQLRDELPAGVYSVGFSMMSGFFLELRRNEFDLPETLFGEIHDRTARLMKRYELNGEVSALLSGAKGSGKTLLAHNFANLAMKNLGKAVILVDNSFENPAGLKEFLVDVGDAVFIFDEFAKNFCEEEQQQMLDFFSGSNAGKRATFVIENRYTDINEFMIDRPGRMRFHFRYSKLKMEVVKEVCDYFNLHIDLTRLIMGYAARSLSFGMDSLHRLIEECMMDEIQTKEAFNDLIEDMNIPNNKEREYRLTEVRLGDVSFNPVGLNNINVNGSGSGLYGSFYNSENHPIIAAMIASEDPKIVAVLDSIDRGIDEDDIEEGEEIKPQDRYWWHDFDIRCNRPTYSMNGELTFIDKRSGLKFIAVEDDGLGDDDLDLLA